MKNACRSIVALGCVFLLSSPVLALEQLEEEDMDRISAAGDPTVIDVKSGEGEAIAAYSDDTSYELQFNVPRAQDGIRALTLMNVVGEAQILTNLNVLSAGAGVGGTDQRNYSAQSWGSTLPDPDTVKTVKAEAYAPACSSLYGITCSGGPGLVGGDAPKVVVSSTAVDTKISDSAASASADVIVRAESKKDKAVVAVDNSGHYKLAFNHEQAQKDLTTLFQANIVGRAQVALNLNIASGGLGLVPGDQTSFASPIGGDVSGTIKQTNTGIQFRGTPLVGSTGTSGGLTTTVNHLNN